jgi:hypothetical protein
MSTNVPSPEHIMQVGLGFWASKTLLSAVEMEVFTELSKKPEDLETLRGRLGLHPRSARDFLDTLTALGFLRRVDGKYANTPATDFYLDKHKPSYLGGILEMANQRLYGHWSHLTEALRTGKQQNEAKDGAEGTSPFEALYADPARLKVFLAAMTGISRGANLSIAQKVSWGQYRSFAERRYYRPKRLQLVKCPRPEAPCQLNQNHGRSYYTTAESNHLAPSRFEPGFPFCHS